MEGSWSGCPTEQKGWGCGLGLGLRGLFQGPSLTSHPRTFKYPLTLEHNMVCWGAQNYCHVKGVGEQEAGAAQCWLSIWREKESVMYSKKEQSCPT